MLLGELGDVGGLRQHLGESQLFTEVECTDLVKVMQMEVVCCSFQDLTAAFGDVKHRNHNFEGQPMKISVASAQAMWIFPSQLKERTRGE